MKELLGVFVLFLSSRFLSTVMFVLTWQFFYACNFLYLDRVCMIVHDGLHLLVRSIASACCTLLDISWPWYSFQARSLRMEADKLLTLFFRRAILSNLVIQLLSINIKTVLYARQIDLHYRLLILGLADFVGCSESRFGWDAWLMATLSRFSSPSITLWPKGSFWVGPVDGVFEVYTVVMDIQGLEPVPDWDLSRFCRFNDSDCCVCSCLFVELA